MATAARDAVVRCPLCGSADGAALGRSRHGVLVRCGGCALAYHPALVVAGAPGQQPSLVPQDDEGQGKAAAPGAGLGESPATSAVAPYYGDDAAYAAYRARKEPQWEELFRRLRGYLRGRAGGAWRLLDVGCARGYSTAVARRLGFAAHGVEPSAADAAYARERLGLPVDTGTVEQASFAPASFDAVVMWSVLEHLTVPQATFAAIARLLRPGGMLNIFTPNGASRAARAQGPAWAEYNRAGHVALYAPASVRWLLSAHGLVPLEIYTTLWGEKGAGEEGNRREGAAAIRTRPLTCLPLHLFGVALRRAVMRPRLAPLRATGRRMLAVVAPRAALAGEYMGVYARKRG